MTLGVDLSNNNGTVDLAAVRGAGYEFAIFKAGEGVVKRSTPIPPFFVDSYFELWVGRARQLGFAVGSYYYGHPGRDPIVQADHYVKILDTVGGAGTLDLPPMLDLETSDGVDVRGMVVWAHAFLTRLEGRTGRLPGYYSYPYFATTQDRSLARYPLWLADYTVPRGLPDGKVPRHWPVGGWDRWHIWQWAVRGGVPGVAGQCDLNFYPGTCDRLVADLGGTVTPAPPAAKRHDEEDDMAPLIIQPGGGETIPLPPNRSGAVLVAWHGRVGVPPVVRVAVGKPPNGPWRNQDGPKDRDGFSFVNEGRTGVIFTADDEVAVVETKNGRVSVSLAVAPA